MPLAEGNGAGHAQGLPPIQQPPQDAVREGGSALPQAPRGRAMTKQEREASRRLIRLSTAAHTAQVKGNCLMVMQLLTRREVLRSHRPWQLIMKHPIWMAFEYRRQLEGRTALEADERVPVTMIEATAACGKGERNSGEEGRSDADVDSINDATSACDGDEDDAASRHRADSMDGSDAAEQGADPVGATRQTPVRLRRRNDNFYEDYLHRGSMEYVAKDVEAPTPLRDMSLYDYAMYVEIVPGDPWAMKPNQYAFDEHHAKFPTHVQQLRAAPAVP